MKKKLLCTLVSLFLVIVGYQLVTGASGRESTKLPPQEVQIMYSTEDHAYQVKDISNVLRWKVLPDGTMSILDSSGVTRFSIDGSGVFRLHDASSNVDAYFPSDRVVYVNTPTQLSTWTGQAATSGQSYYQCSPGKIYIVDPHALATYGCKPGGTTAMGTAFTGVSMILPNAATYSGPAYDVQIIVGNTGTTGHVSPGISGSTTVQVWPYAGSAGLTAYSIGAGNYASTYRTGCTPQWLLGEYTIAGAVGSVTVYAGNSYWELNKLSESATFGLYNGLVSAFVVNKKVSN